MSSTLLIEGVVAIGMVLLLLVIYPRIVSSGKVLCHFHENKRAWSSLLKEDRVDGCIWIGKEDNPDREKYMIDQDKLFFTAWPGGLPSFLQVQVRTLWFKRHESEPFDPSRHHSKYGAKYLRFVTDTNMLESQWKDVRTSLGLKAKNMGMNNIILLAGIGLVAILVLVEIILTRQNSSTLHNIYKLLHGVTPPVGK